MNETQQACSGIALAVGSVRGLRAFNIDSYGRLTAVTNKSVWRPGENVAVCKRTPMDFLSGSMYRALSRSIITSSSTTSLPAWGIDKCPSVAHPLCTCGFYGYHDGSKYESGDVVGIIDGYGKTTVGTKGFRCEKATIAALCVPGNRRMAWPDRLSLFAAVFCSLVGLALVVGLLFDSAPWYVPIAAGLCLGSGVVNYLFFRIALTKHRRYTRRVAPLRDLIARNYPDVPLYDDLKAMTHDFPPDRGEEPSPNNDPDFWERS